MAGPIDRTALVRTEVTEGRLARQWASIERQLPSPTAARLSWPRIAALGVPTLCLAVAVLWLQRDRLTSNGAVIESSDGPFAVQLRDGSSLELAAQSRLRVLRDQPSAVDVEIEDGRVNFDVKHVAARSFSVRAGVVSVRVVGTQFHVVKAARREGMEIEVAVQRGVVEVQRSDRAQDVRRLAAGETWSVWVAAETISAPSPPLPAATPVVAAPSEPAPVVPPPPRGTVRATAKVVAPAPSSSADEAREKPEGVQALFLRANVARRAGRMQDAATAYAEVLKRFAHDSRAGVSAFELGRIRMDALHDPKGAALAFADALRLSHKAEFREDALARLAIASDVIGDYDTCRSARSRYLNEYAAGVHEKSLSGLCGLHEP